MSERQKVGEKGDLPNRPSVMPRSTDEEERELVVLGQIILVFGAIAFCLLLWLWVLP